MDKQLPWSMICCFVFVGCSNSGGGSRGSSDVRVFLLAMVVVLVVVDRMGWGCL